jgi:hypothetical protein
VDGHVGEQMLRSPPATAAFAVGSHRAPHDDGSMGLSIRIFIVNQCRGARRAVRIWLGALMTGRESRGLLRHARAEHSACQPGGRVRRRVRSLDPSAAWASLGRWFGVAPPEQSFLRGPGPRDVAQLPWSASSFGVQVERCSSNALVEGKSDRVARAPVRLAGWAPP